ncbi:MULTISPECIES: hypothetical protein [Desulfitobacterium]|uniref:Uncharacterized protein n=1 Tax=Desulfitobacterium dehalogenans (strain ATCC 51507 / DSM 9161 / JW/IU-DC1) TaxID=756499 RepID=I4AEP0_DESDJ|nr:hypothetical protein Desde_4164 [Desulfitobacterium dehalogenans ATCC 51507]
MGLKLLVTTAAKKFILDNGMTAIAKNVGWPTVELGEPKEEELGEYQAIDLGEDIKLYTHISILSLDDFNHFRIDYGWKLTGKGLTIKSRWFKDKK